MSNQNDPSRPALERKLALSTLIRHTMITVAEREEQRSKLVNVLVLAQFLVTAMTTAGYIDSPTMIPSMLLGTLALVIYGCAYLTNRFFHRSEVASYILVIGGGLAIAGQVLVLALESQPLQAGQASLLFVAIILEAGLLFSPEITLLTAFSTTVFAAFAILLGLSSNHTIQRSDAYFAVAFTLGLLALTALISWLLSQYIVETSMEAQRGQELQFAQARLEALSSQTNDHQRLLDDSVDKLLQTISRVLTGEYPVRAEIPESELTPLGASLNVLFERYEAATHAERMRWRMEGGALSMIDTISRMTDTNTPTPPSLPPMTYTPMDSVSLALQQMQASLNHRLGRLQRLSTDVVSSLNHSQVPLSDASDSVHEAQRMAGALIAAAETVLTATRRQLDDIFTVRRMLRPLLPEEITRTDITLPPNTGELTGLGPDLRLGSGYTGHFEAVSPRNSGLDEGGQADNETGIAPLTRPMAAIPASSADEGRNVTDAGNLPTTAGDAASYRRGRGNELVETWNLLTKIDNDMRQSERLLSTVESQLGAQSKQLRAVDTSIAWFRSALEAVRSYAEQLQQVAGTLIQAPGSDLSVPPASPSRPLSPSPDLSQSPDLPESQQPHPIADEAGAGPGDSIHTPGSLRASDLFSLDNIDFASLGDARTEDKEQPDDE